MKVDNAINNAAGENQKHFLKVSEKELNDMVSINLKSTFIISQIFAKKMIKINSIVGISLIILKYFDPNVFLSSLNAFKHDPR